VSRAPIPIGSFLELLGLRDLSPAQLTLLRAVYSERLSDEERRIFEECTEQEYTARDINEVTAICGARSGKDSRIATPVVLYEAVVRDHSYLHRGERGLVIIVAQDARAGQVAFGYIRAALEGSDVLRRHVVDIRRSEIDLDNAISIAVHPCTYRAARGFTVVAAVCDEVAFWRDENSQNPDREIIRSLRRGMANVPNPKLIKISTPYGRSGVLWDDFQRRHSLPHALVWRAPTWLMNPSISASFLRREEERDPEAYRREYAAEFSDSISSAFNREAVEQCVVVGRFELPPRPGTDYVAGVDPAGGGPDEFSLSIVHWDGGRIVQDCLRAFRSTKPDDLVEEFARLLRRYRVADVVGDRYSGQWVRDAFRKRSITYEVCSMSASEAFLELLPLVLQGSSSIELLDDRVQTAQLLSLERRRGPSGRDILGHPSGGHDDRVNALAIAVTAKSWMYQRDVW
jgi:hypothetical protein